jgi:hypothetical protein
MHRCLEITKNAELCKLVFLAQPNPTEASIPKHKVMEKNILKLQEFL